MRTNFFGESSWEGSPFFCCLETIKTIVRRIVLLYYC